ncbi:putative DNA helicase INO80 [Kluyveromyces marxianus DMKU3-1042]|uniref:Chromatin-remodeling ATPase INO80 n=1 Tax=Kluyveromyces marxianus (strain DMKU3-1042 / BCC 29191 / NBRC 104275) TaxID=1003335 RepID=W0TH80_KLUMD|nr:putative DNA helicase INO80 [Kluyveromyces marxianus DMKU3-1042]BAO42413.1 putative DNA helicase INO80 [Kluyveromyces marxianus DMKU3-1042]
MYIDKVVNREENRVVGVAEDLKRKWELRMARICERDDREMDYQNWKFLSYQEFELINEWNQQGKELTKDGCVKLLANMKQTHQEWEDYQKVKEQKDSIIEELKESIQIIKQEPAVPSNSNSNSNSTSDGGDKNTNDDDDENHHHNHRENGFGGVGKTAGKSPTKSPAGSPVPSSGSTPNKRRARPANANANHRPKRPSNLSKSVRNRNSSKDTETSVSKKRRTPASAANESNTPRKRPASASVSSSPSVARKGGSKSSPLTPDSAKNAEDADLSQAEEDNLSSSMADDEDLSHKNTEEPQDEEEEEEGEGEGEDDDEEGEGEEDEAAAKAEEDVDEEEDDIDDIKVPEDDGDDDDFAPSYSAISKVKVNKKVTLDSPMPAIQKELRKMAIKSSIAKAMKRKFTNCKVQTYAPDTELEIKITLKQLHIRKYKRHLAEIERKRKAEEAALKAEEEAKKRKLAPPPPPPQQVKSKDHDLPTYGMKITLKEARAIQRHYDQTYITIWKDMARRDSGRISRQLQQIQSIRSQNFKKTSSLCAKEARRWQMRNFRQVKDFQTRARRGIREMSSFWKKNEREEREMKKKAEKEALEQAKKEEEERENLRAAKKLNFLLTQTELYSHFIGSKIKTNELEGNMTDESLAAMQNNNKNKGIDISKTAASKTDIQSIDFAEEDDDNLTLMAAQNASNALRETQEKARKFDEEDEADGELNFQNPTSLGEITIDQPKMLACTLKEYQLKGLNWLANLYDQGINGILADEMGLGKTVQSISVLAHLADRYNIWGPFIVVTPASTLHNWVNEISRFVPQFKILPYWGNANDRKTLRKFWDRKHLRYGKDAPFHVMVTSYQMVVSDANYLQKMKWQYMILDEAQAIKSSQSSRWKTLLSFHCRNRLLLTGTPIQNNMQELWALLHFIMPSLFDNHDEFSDWFSKDIESHAESNTELNQEQLRRLHMVLKPFMLRRIKKNVQSELGDKIEIDVLCDLTFRQAKLYQILKSQVSGGYDAIENAAGADDVTSDQKLVNLVMEFRKVCNHPDLFERADVSSPFSFVSFGESSSLLREGDFVEVNYSAKNLINYKLPRLIYDEFIVPNYNNDVDVRAKLLYHSMNIFHPSNSIELCNTLSKLTGMSASTFTKLLEKDVINRAIDLARENNSIMEKCEVAYDHGEKALPSCLLISNKLKYMDHLKNVTTGGVLQDLLEIQSSVFENEYLNSLSPAYHPAAAAPPINIEIMGSNNFVQKKQRELFNPRISSALSSIPPSIQHKLLVEQNIPIEELPITELAPRALNNSHTSYITMPSMDRFITESAKLKKLDELLVKLKEEDHRVLIYFQMTKMMDLMEEYLTYRQYKHIRLDGSSKLDDRRDLVHDWQTKPDIFIFLLSTRAGGLGINLTAADTVIFYDSDWNPTIDSQAMDRAHRLGQTRQVTVYRLLIRGTIEERMRDRAKQKEHVQQVVMEGKAKQNKVKIVEVEKEKEKEQDSAPA